MEEFNVKKRILNCDWYRNYMHITDKDIGYPRKNCLFAPNKTNVVSKNKLFYYTNNKMGDYVPIIEPWHFIRDITECTPKVDSFIKRHYNDPFISFNIKTEAIRIRKDGDKVSINIFRHTKYRDANHKYFHHETNSYGISINLLSLNFYTYDINKSGKKMSKKFKKIRCNNFNELLKKFFHIINFLSESFSDEDKLTFYLKLSSFLNLTDDDYLKVRADVKNLVNIIMYRFISVKKIKPPNDYEFFMYNLYPGEKFLKKNNRKLIASILDKYKIKNNLFIKILHEHPIIYVPHLTNITTLFGENYIKYISNIDYEKLVKWCCSIPRIRIDDNLILTENEKSNIIKIINNIKHNTILYDFTIDLNDHLNAIKRYLEFTGIREHITSTTYDTFNAEHSDLSVKCNLIRKEFHCRTTYPEELISKFKEWTYNDETSVYYGKVLCDEEEYIEEGSYMHHCVGGYVYSKNVIISLRKRDTKERVTIEVQCNSGDFCQVKYFSNQQYPECFEAPLNELKTITNKLAKNGNLKFIEKVKVRNKTKMPIEGDDIVVAIDYNNPFNFF